MIKTEIKDLYRNLSEYDKKEVVVSGWIRTIRDSKNFGFIELNDGTFFSNMQVVFDADKIENYKEVASLNVGASITVTATDV